jgi:hypothetical protein
MSSHPYMPPAPALIVDTPPVAAVVSSSPSPVVTGMRGRAGALAIPQIASTPTAARRDVDELRSASGDVVKASVVCCMHACVLTTLRVTAR